MKELIAFLKKHRVLTKFKKNFKKHGHIADLEYFCSIVDTDSHISGAFGWDDTEEGLDFWDDLNIKWKESK